MKKYNAIIFDLDGVICHTDQYHYEAWKAVADELGIYFDEAYTYIKIPASAEKICGRRVFCRKLFLVEFECLRYNEPIEFFCFGKDRDSIPDEAEV